MINIFINNKKIKVFKGFTVLQACIQANIDVPRFCYHEKLSVAGNCRMCLVEVEKMAKPVASCAMPVLEGMRVSTTSNMVRRAREGVLEFLLINHPLDCPICDAGGECELQDITFIYGRDRSRFKETKRSVVDKEIGCFIKTIMTRCIHCTRCIRFMKEIAGVPGIGLVGRGSQVEVSNYVSKMFDSELSGNIIDLCPVGALTAKSYAFKSRAWELEEWDTIDLSDSLHSNIKVLVKGNQIVKVLPGFNPEVNGMWISDITRFKYDGIYCDRISKFWLNRNFFREISSIKSIHILRYLMNLSKGSILGCFGAYADLRSLISYANIIRSYGGFLVSSNISFPVLHNDYFFNLVNWIDFRENFITKFTALELKDCDVILFVGVNIRYECSLRAAEIREQVKRGKLIVAYIGECFEELYDYYYLGNDVNDFITVLEGRSWFSKYLIRSTNVHICIGDSLLGIKCPLLVSFLLTIQRNYLFFSISYISSSASMINFLELGFLDYFQNSRKWKLAYLFDNEHFSKESSIFTIFEGSFGSSSLDKVNLIIPSTTTMERHHALFINLNGYIQATKKVLDFEGEVVDDWNYMGEVLNKDSDVFLLQNEYLFKSKRLKLKSWSLLYNDISYSFSLFNSKITNAINKPNYYLSDMIARRSSTILKALQKLSN